MKNNNYHIQLSPKSMPADLWQAVLNVRAWWAQDTEGQPQHTGDQFTVRFGTTWATFVVSELKPKQMIWTVTASYLDLLADTQEWTATRLIFERTGGNSQDAIEITHHGLTPQKECFDDCQQGWNFFLGESLLKYMNEGEGLPAIGIHAWIAINGQTIRGKLYSPEQSPEASARPMLLLDVKDTRVEQILSIYEVRPYSGEAGKLKGKFYALVPDENGLLEKLQKLDDNNDK